MSLSKFFLLLLFLVGGRQLQAAEPLRVSLLLGDIATKQTADVIEALQTGYPLLARVEFKIYPSTRISEKDFGYLERSDLVIIQIMGRNLINSIKEPLTAAIRRGSRVYWFGGTVTEADTQMGIRTDARLKHYLESGGTDNLKNGLLYALTKLGLDLPCEAPRAVPETGIYDPDGKGWYTDFDTFKKHYRRYRPDRPWVGFHVYRANVMAGTTSHFDALIHALERRGYNVVTVFGYPSEKPIEAYFFDAEGRPRVEAVVAAGIKIGVTPGTLIPLLKRLDVPVINAVSLGAMTRAEWEASPVGMDIMERSWQLAMPEMAGLVQPTVFAAKERITDPRSGATYVEERAIPERVDMLARRIDRWITLRRKPNGDKRVFLQYFNFPPGREAIGASMLNVVPGSLWRVMKRLQQEGYDLSGMPDDERALQDAVVGHGGNIPVWNHSEITKLARSGRAVLLPMETYKKWFAALPPSVQTFVTKGWGAPENDRIMRYSDAEGNRYFVLPVLRYGNILLGPQPSRGWTENPEKLYHDVLVAPPHYYLAFYLWLLHEFKPDAMLQFGTHGTHEWLPGKEAGLSGDDLPELLLRDLPNLYVYIVDDTGEATIAQRRGLGIMISHMTPPFDKAGLNPELRKLKAQIADYQAALQKSPQNAEARLPSIVKTAEHLGILKELEPGAGSAEKPTPALVEKLHEYLEEIAKMPTPFGLHTLGAVPDEKAVAATAEAIVSVDGGLDAAQRKARIETFKTLIRQSAGQELDAVVNALSGRYIAAGPGGDPLRSPDIFPTGRNLYSFDPRRIPSPSTYALGEKLAKELIETYKRNHGAYPDKLTFTLWGVETMRHEGVAEAQIMFLMGVRPVWDKRGIVRSVEAIPRAELGRPRIDVTVIPSGLHRDLFSNVIALLDQAVNAAQQQDESDNAVRNNTLETQAKLEATGIRPDLAARMAAVRMFTAPSGAYGTNLEYVIDRSDTWEDEKNVTDVYFMRMSHMYGQGFWGDSGEEVTGQKGVGKTLFERALSGTKMTVHARSSNVYGVLTGDDPFQSFGGVSMAVRAIDGKTPEVYLSNLAVPNASKMEALDKYMGREMRTRYFNPAWIKAMQKEGYAGAKAINRTVQNLWGWQVTVPSAVDAAKWNEIYEIYVKDRYKLDMEQFFRDSGNLWAYEAMMSRMLEAVRKGYWKADASAVKVLGEHVSRLIEELQLQCTETDCHDPVLTKLVQAKLVPVPAMAAAPAAAETAARTSSAAAGPAETGRAPKPSASSRPQQVTGKAMEEVKRNPSASGTETGAPSAWFFYLLLGLAFLWGFLGKTNNTRKRHPLQYNDLPPR